MTKKPKGCICRCYDSFCQPDCKCEGHWRDWKNHRIDYIHRHVPGVYDG